MQDTSVTPKPENPRSEKRITRKNLVSSLAIGFVLGAIAGSPIGWFAHQFYAQQRAAQVLLCRQQNNSGLNEPQLKDKCGPLF